MFEVGGWYANRRGKYQVLAVHGDALSVHYADGEDAELTVKEQERIIQNIEREKVVYKLAPSTRRSSTGVSKTSGFYWLLGFLANPSRRTHLLAFVPDKASRSFANRWQDVGNGSLSPDQKGVTWHPPETDKRWYECRITFVALPDQVRVIGTIVPQFRIVSGGEYASDSWNINNNKLFWGLCEYGFVVGSPQSLPVIRSRIPSTYVSDFERGLST
jgi:hypothetical protein